MKKKQVKNDARVSLDISAEQFDYLDAIRKDCERGGGSRLNRSTVIRALITGAKEAGLDLHLCNKQK